MNKIQKLRSRAAQFKKTDGSVAIIAAVTISAVIMTAGIAVDYGQSVTMRSKMQAAADAASLAAASTQLTNAQRIKMAKDIFAQNIDLSEFTTPPNVTVVMGASGEDVTVSATGKIRTNFMRIAGYHNMTVGVDSSAGVQSINAEIALVLDVSGSMRAWMGAQSRIDVLRA
ncbi:MAG: hypothetical protein HKN60_05695 [Rhizobiales bacterium]|nr:hypothetical protein [Hyphomicrobiales bacterium]